MLPLQPGPKVSEAYWFVDRQHSFSSARHLQKLHGSGAEGDDGGSFTRKMWGWWEDKKGSRGGVVEGVEGDAARETKWGNERSTDAVLAFLLQWCDGAISLRRSRGQEWKKHGETWRRRGWGSSSKRQLLWFRTVRRDNFGMIIPGHPHSFTLNTKIMRK